MSSTHTFVCGREDGDGSKPVKVRWFASLVQGHSVYGSTVVTPTKTRTKAKDKECTEKDRYLEETGGPSQVQRDSDRTRDGLNSWREMSHFDNLN